MNEKRLHRWYRLEGLQLRMRVRRRNHQCWHRGPVSTATHLHERWSMDFVHDALADGHAFRILTVVDQWSRQSPVLEVAAGMSGLELTRRLRSVPSTMVTVEEHSKRPAGR